MGCERLGAVWLWSRGSVTCSVQGRCAKVACLPASHCFVLRLIENVRPTRPICLPRTLSHDAYTLGRRPLMRNKGFHLTVICPPTCTAEKESVFISGVLCDTRPLSPLLALRLSHHVNSHKILHCYNTK